jgi:ABC-type oligopeptide transport system substrate-binding subunit
VVETKNTGKEPETEGIIFKVTPDETARMMGFESGSFDVLNQPQYMDIERLEKSGKYKSHTQPSSELYWYNFNLLMEPFDQKEIRHPLPMRSINR